MTMRLLYAIALSASFVMDASGQDDANPLEGKWRLVMAEVDGRQLPESAIRKLRLTISHDKYLYTPSVWGTFTSDPNKKPTTIDLVPAVGSDKGKTQLGIYRIDGDELQLCIAAPGSDRPSEFTTKTGPGHVLEVFRRQKR